MDLIVWRTVVVNNTPTPQDLVLVLHFEISRDDGRSEEPFKFATPFIQCQVDQTWNMCRQGENHLIHSCEFE
jgi:hypothetical protein